MPFEIEADGPYYSVLDFFARLGRLSRIINVGDLKLTAIGTKSNGKFRMTPGTSVTGTFTITTFYTQAAQVQAKTAFPPRPGRSVEAPTMTSANTPTKWLAGAVATCWDFA